MRTSTEQKLALLRGTKDAIKAALIEKGQSVIDTDTFRSYADKVLAIKSGGDGAPDGYVTVTFMNGDTVLFTRFVLKGDDCPDPVEQGRIETPTKESTAQYTYTHNGWATADGGSADANVLKNITGDKTLYAAFAESVRKYTVTYYDDDGVTVLHTEQVAYGATPSYVPTKAGVAFNGWTPELSPVTGDASYTASWLAAIDSGTCGASANWLLDGSYVLTISGEGTVTQAPWKTNYASQIQAVVIEEGITGITRSDAFTNASNLKSITIPTTLTKFGVSGSGLTGLESVHIGSLSQWCGLTLYSSGFFSISVPNARIYVNGEAVEGAVTIPDDVTEIADYSFAQYLGITSLTIPASVTRVGKEAFSGMQNGGLTSVVFEGDTKTTTTTIDLLAFRWAYKLSNVVLSQNVETLGQQAFNGCSNLKSITIPASVTEIGYYVFTGTGLTSAVFEDTEGWTAGDTAIASSDLANTSTAATYLKTTYTQKWTKS